MGRGRGREEEGKGERGDEGERKGGRELRKRGCFHESILYYYAVLFEDMKKAGSGIWRLEKGGLGDKVRNLEWMGMDFSHKSFITEKEK